MFSFDLMARYYRFKGKVVGNLLGKLLACIRNKTFELVFTVVRFGNFTGILNRQVLVAFGDSTTAWRAERGLKRTYCQRLRDILKVHKINAVVINVGAAGSHSGSFTDNSVCGKYHALDRLDRGVRNHKPSIVIIQFGLNDSWVDGDDPVGPSRISLARFEQNINFIINTLKKDGSQIILMTPNQLGSFYPRWRNERLFLYSEVVRQLGIKNIVGLVDVWELYEDYALVAGRSMDDLLLDSMHPNDAGHQLVAEGLARRILEMQRG